MADPSGEFGHDYTCREVVELASDYLEGAMTVRQMTAFELHLNFCDGCSTFVDQIRTTAAMALGVTEDRIPDDLKAKLLDAFRDWKRE
jgi:predicted anti-sigma-YlaC factor YlaD